MGQRRKGKVQIRAKRVVARASNQMKNKRQKKTPGGPRLNMAAKQVLRKRAQRRKAQVSKDHHFSASKVNFFNFGASKMQGLSFWTCPKLKYQLWRVQNDKPCILEMCAQAAKKARLEDRQNEDERKLEHMREAFARQQRKVALARKKHRCVESKRFHFGRTSRRRRARPKCAREQTISLRTHPAAPTPTVCASRVKWSAPGRTWPCPDPDGACDQSEIVCSRAHSGLPAQSFAEGGRPVGVAPSGSGKGQVRPEAGGSTLVAPRRPDPNGVCVQSEMVCFRAHLALPRP